VIQVTQTTLLLSIQLPLNDGGVPVYGYYVQYASGNILQFMLGIYQLLSNRPADSCKLYRKNIAESLLSSISSAAMLTMLNNIVAMLALSDQ
jgi:hypothetical protein